MFKKGLKTFGIIMMICLLIIGMFPGSLAAEEIPEAADEETVTVEAVESDAEAGEVAEETTTEDTTEEESFGGLLGSQATTTGYKADTEPADDPVSTPEAVSSKPISAAYNTAAAKAQAAKAKKKKPTPKINIKKRKITIKKGKKKKLAFTVKNASRKKVKWSSSNKRVATVNSKGVVSVKSGGKCVITARIKGTEIKDTIVVKGRDYYYMRVKTTGYCNCSRCAGPWAGCRTAIGRYPRANHTIAVDRRVIKLGTRVKIGKITYVAEDTGGGVRGRMVDIYYKSHSRAMRHGVKWRTAKIYF